MSVKLSLEASAFSSGLRLAINSLGNFVKNAAAAQGKTAELNTALKQLGAGAVITGVGVLLAKGLGDAAGKAAELQVVMKQIGMATGASAKQMADFSKTFTDIGLKNQMSNMDAATVALAEVHAGITDPAKVKASVGTIANYAEVQQLSNHTDRVSAATTAAEFAHAFGAYAPNLLNPLVNDLSKALTHAPTTGAGFLRLISQFSGATRNAYGTTQPDHLKMQHEDILMGTLLAQMGQGTRGGTQLSSALMHMTSTAAGRKGTAQLEQLGGGQFYNADGTFKSNENFLKILSTAAKKEDNPLAMDNIMKNAFGLTGLRLMGMLSDPNSLKQYQSNEATFARVPGIATQQNVLNNTNAGQIQQLHKNLDTLVRLFATGLLPILNDATRAFVGVTKAAVQFASANPGIMKVAAVVALVATALALVVGPILMAVATFSILSIAVDALGLSFLGLDIGLLPLTLIILGIGAVIAGVILIITHWNDVVKVATGIWNGIAQTFRIVWEIISKSPLGAFLMGVLLPFAPAIIMIVGAVKLAVFAFQQLGNIAKAIAGPVKAVADGVGTVLGAVPGAAGTFLNWAGVDKQDNPFVKHQVKPGHKGGGGGPGDVHHHTHQGDIHLHIHGADAKTNEHLGKIAAKHVAAAQGRELKHVTNNSPLHSHGLHPRYQ